MSVIVRFGSRKAILCAGEWTAADRVLEERLNQATQSWLRETGGPAIGDADPDFTTAMTIGVAHGGKIHRHVARPSTQRVYLQARQMEMF